MTIVQASICDNGKAIILVADRMITQTLFIMRYEKEGFDSKIYVFGNNGVGFAGNSQEIEEIVSNIDNPKDFEELIEKILSIMKKKKDEYLNRQIKKTTLFDDINEFKKSNAIPPDIRNLIYGKSLKFQIECDSLVVGFDKDKKAKIVIIDSKDFIAHDITKYSHYSVGSGFPFSFLHFDQEEYNPNWDLKKGIYTAFRAKKLAEAHVGVGYYTDLIILRQDKKPIMLTNEDEMIEKLNSIFLKEKNEIDTIRSNIIEELKIDEWLENVEKSN